LIKKKSMKKEGHILKKQDPKNLLNRKESLSDPATYTTHACIVFNYSKTGQGRHGC